MLPNSYLGMYMMAMRLRRSAHPTAQYQLAVVAVLDFFSQLGHAGHVITPLCPHFSICKMIFLHKRLRVMLKNNAVNRLCVFLLFLSGFFFVLRRWLSPFVCLQTFQLVISTKVSLTICIRCDHLLIGHHSCSGIVNLKVRKGRGTTGKEA